MDQLDQPNPSSMPPPEPFYTAEFPVPPPPPPDTTVPPPSPPRRSARTFVAIVAAVVLVAGAIVGIAIAAGGGSKDAGAPQPASSPTIAPPVGLTGTAEVVPFGVTLSWSAPSGDAKI